MSILADVTLFGIRICEFYMFNEIPIAIVFNKNVFAINIERENNIPY